MTPSQAARTIGILIFDEVEVLDFCGPFEVFSVSRPDGVKDDEARLFKVFTVAEKNETVRCRGGLLVEPHYTIGNAPKLDILIVPGGQGTRRERHNQNLLDWIEAQNKQTEMTLSVCTGAFLLAERGLLDGKKATTHWGSIDFMRETYPHVEIVENTRYVDEGRIVTSAGISAGIDMSLHVVETLHGQEVAAWTARRMEYEWNKG